MPKDQLILPRADSAAVRPSTATGELLMDTASPWNSGIRRPALSVLVITWPCTAASNVVASTSASGESRNRLRNSSLHTKHCRLPSESVKLGKRECGRIARFSSGTAA